jgi:multiple sugar transport system substrate-binding protein
MKLPYRSLLGAVASVVMASTAMAQDHVRWNDDGTVDLMLGPNYDDTVITTTREELGTLFGPGELPFEGAEISVTVNSSGPKGGISGPLHAFRPVWEELSGGKLNIVELPFGEHYTKMMLDLRNGTGEYDGFMVGAFWYGDIAPAGYGFPIDDLMASDEYPQWTYDSMPPALKALHQWGGESYGVLNDADGQVLYYRSDALNDPEHQAAFKAEYGYDMPVPPKTWQQLRDIAQYFDGKNWDDNDPDQDSGMVMAEACRRQRRHLAEAPGAQGVEGEPEVEPGVAALGSPGAPGPTGAEVRHRVEPAARGGRLPAAEEIEEREHPAPRGEERPDGTDAGEGDAGVLEGAPERRGVGPLR